MADTRQVLVAKEVISVKRRNVSLKSQIQYVGIPEKDNPLVPQGAGPFQCKYIFTNGWPTQRGRNLGITVERELYVYNHQISPENYRHSPGIHQQSQAGASNVYQYIRDNSNHQVNMTDVFTSGSMRAMLGIFPGMLRMDCTYKTNKYNYQLLTIVATYPFGQVQPVQYSLIGTTTVEAVGGCVLCYHFHTIKWLHETIRKSKRYGLYPADILTQTKHIITNMNVERTQDSYEMHRVEFESLSCRDDQKKLWKYFKKN
ncbi:Secreted protein [Phytophthora palmivora]|uniref:Secreted protein n=1 Tax=Phytophthora palmivora TaxID=4796 RepID=A0A2P4YF82_9STRA|nr:Secreted protein [Phytophthora palmivora]